MRPVTILRPRRGQTATWVAGKGRIDTTDHRPDDDPRPPAASMAVAA